MGVLQGYDWEKWYRETRHQLLLTLEDLVKRGRCPTEDEREFAADAEELAQEMPEDFWDITPFVQPSGRDVDLYKLAKTIEFFCYEGPPYHYVKRPKRRSLEQGKYLLEHYGYARP